MLSTRKLVFSPIVAIAAVAGLVITAGASSAAGSLHSTLAPSHPTDPPFHSVTAGGVPWVLNHGRVSITPEGEFNVELDGLVIPGLGTPGPVTTVSASLYCGGDANVSPAATTRPANLSSRGDAEISDHVTLPETCLAPIVLIHPNNGLARYIAVTGWRA
ncbi:MAG: hypothetical protein E6I88_05330 [Chloroflexi bacterium]|nr:MAG: hypothetical protein E6I88_05330 [Chloroflexota bacterium]TME48616.1 MAG: hypothetical protein E6I56_00780 [Chloroflexota bacterium]